MKTLTLASSIVLAATTLLSLLTPTSAHMAMSNPPGQAGPWSKNPSNAVHAWIGYEGKKFPCGMFFMSSLPYPIPPIPKRISVY